MSDTKDVSALSSKESQPEPHDSRREFLGKVALLAGGLSALNPDSVLASETGLQSSPAQEKHAAGNLEKKVSLILAQLEAEARAVHGAQVLAADGGYCDFFVENQ